MEVYQDGMYWRVANTRGPVPNVLKGDWVSKGKAEEAVRMFHELVRSRAINVTQRNRERKERAANTTKDTG